MLNSLSNPKTPHYKEFKKWVLGPDFYWNYNAQGGVKFPGGYSDRSVPFYTRAFIKRPEISKYPVTAQDPHEVDSVVKVMTEILEHNKYNFNSILRLAVNCVHPEKVVTSSFAHVDHYFPHKNFIIYLTSAGGSTFVEGKEYSPKEDDAIVFSGEHYMKTPEHNRRVILVATMI